MVDISGGCLCGKVRYTVSAAPIFTGVCHCHDCQKSTGSAFSVVVAVPKDAVEVTGMVKTFTKSGDTGQPRHRQFCPECGTVLMGEADVMPGVVMISLGTLDDASVVQPAMQIYCDSAQPWARLPDLQGFPKMPPGPS